MTISSTTSRNDYTGNGAVNTYAYGFKIFANTDLKVTVRDTADAELPTLTLTTDYTVTDVGEDGGGNIVLVDSSQSWLTGGFLTTNYDITIRRVRPLTQDTDIRNQGDFFPEVHEDQFDREVMIAQQQQDEIDRSLKVDETDPALGLTIPAVSVRASKFLAFDASGDPIASSGAPDSVVPVSPFMETVLDDTTSTIARTTLGFSGASGTVATANIEALAVTKAKMQAGLLLSPGQTRNIGLVGAQTSVANDSIRIQGAGGSALSASNPGYVVVPGVTAGQLKIFEVTANVTIPLTGATGGAIADLTDQKWVMGALNNDGSLVWGAGFLSQPEIILNADDVTSAASLTSAEKVLVNSALTADAQFVMIGFFKANFDFTDGSSEKLWTVQTGDGDIVLGYKDIPIIAQFNSNDGAETLTTGSTVVRDYEDKVLDTHNAVTVGSSWTFKAPIAGQYKIAFGHEFGAAAWSAANLVTNLTVRVATVDKIGGRFTSQAAATYRTEINASGIVIAAKGDSIDSRVFQNSAVTLTFSGDASLNFISINYEGI